MSDNVLGRDDRPRFFLAGNASDLALELPEPRHDVAVRTLGRSLAGMQKEALVVSSATGAVWRLVSDEGPYLNGHDEAPFPLAFLSAGMAASYVTEITELARQRGMRIDELRLTQDNYYTMEGSAIQGTMVGGALPPELQVEIEADGDRDIRSLCADAVDASPLNGLLRGSNTSRFTLTHNGEAIPPGRVAPLGSPALPDLADWFEKVTVGGPDAADQLVLRSDPADRHDGDGGRGSSLQAEQRRTLHVRATCVIGDDGVKDIEITLFKPTGSSFRFLSEEPSHGQPGRAPDAATLISAGIGFCFMTQFGRYAAITKKRLDHYRIVQDTHFSLGGASGRAGTAGRADPVDTHVYVDTPEDEEFSRRLLEMGEQTCFLHALCRTDLEPRLTVVAG